MAGKYEFEDRRQEQSKRGYWANKAEFILACFGNAWGASTWVRFPYLCYRLGGFPIFFVAYVVMLFHVGLPMMLLEMTLGQYSSQGVVGVWQMCPLFKGVGISMLLYACITLAYTIPYMSWPLYYLYASIAENWLDCDNPWNTNSCSSANSPRLPRLPFLNATICDQRSYTVKMDGYCYDNGARVAIFNKYIYEDQPMQLIPAAEEFFTSEFLRSNESASGSFYILWPRVVCTSIFCVLLVICLCVGVRSLGKVVYITSTVPFILLITFLVQALTLPGSDEGMQYLFQVNLNKLTDHHLWVAAAAEVIFGLGLGYGGYLTLASYNRFQNYYVSDAIIVLLANAIVRLLAAVIVMGFAGYLAHSQGLAMNYVMVPDSKIVYTLIPDALSRLPTSTTWCFIFFLLVFLMQFSSALPIMEVILTAVCDSWRPLLRFRFIVMGIISSTFLLVGIIFCTPRLQSIFTVLDAYLPFCSLLIICAMTVCTAIFYGIRWMRHDIRLMLGDHHICLMVIAAIALIPAAINWFLLPLTSLALLGFNAITFQSPTSKRLELVVTYCALAIIALPMLLCPIIMFIIACCRGCKCWPVIRPESKWGPHLSRFRIKATHLPHINVSPSERVRLDRMTPRYDM